MIDLNKNFNRKNTELLIEGIWYSELPPIMDIKNINAKVDEIFNLIDNKCVECYIHNDQNRIVDYRKLPKSSNRHSNGAEPIVFYDYKSNGAWREMQIPNLIYYISFVYNTMNVFDEIFELLYVDIKNKELISNSNSYLVFDELFVEHGSYGDIEEIDFKGQFTNKNTKIRSSLILEENKKRYLKMEDGYLYFMKLDIESFFPNLYTHFFDRMKEFEPYKGLGVAEHYFEFLDKYNMKIGNNQTKGIPAGVFSSYVSSELLMLCVDYEIRKEIEGIDVGYIRYVDDITLFSDEKEKLFELKTVCQKILNKYRLRINGNKTEIHLCTRNNDKTNLKDIYSLLPYLKTELKDIYSFRIDDLFELKNYLKLYLENNEVSQIKSILTLFSKQIASRKVLIGDCSYELFSYIWKLIGEDEKLGVHIYKMLDTILEQCSLDKKNRCIEQLKKKSNLIDNKFSDSLLQIWHYYVIFKYDAGYRNDIIKDIKNKELSPIVVTMLVRDGKKNNKELFSYIRETYKAEIGDPSDAWKQTIMFSKWWLPIYQISLIDEHKYDNWLHTKSYPNILKLLSPIE